MPFNKSSLSSEPLKDLETLETVDEKPKKKKEEGKVK